MSPEEIILWGLYSCTKYFLATGNYFGVSTHKKLTSASVSFSESDIAFLASLDFF
jgi:hypothetical protein